MATTDGTIQRLRRDMSDTGEPLIERECTVVGAGTDQQTPYVTPTQAGVEILGVEVGDELSVEIYEAGILITTDDE